MTHDELLEDLNIWVRFLADSNKGKEWVKALLAVVELHKPSGEGLGYAAYCHQCMFNHGSGEIKNHAYPCLTIQAIEKELQ